jgi:hypothetical protein
MRFMYLIRHPGPSANPTPELLEAMHKLADREIKAGRMLDNGGLMPVHTGAQVRIADGKPRSRSWTASCTSPRSKPTICCEAFAATCCTGLAALMKRAPRLRPPQRWRATGANRSC